MPGPDRRRAWRTPSSVLPACWSGRSARPRSSRRRSKRRSRVFVVSAARPFRCDDAPPAGPQRADGDRSHLTTRPSAPAKSSKTCPRTTAKSAACTPRKSYACRCINSTIEPAGLTGTLHGSGAIERFHSNRLITTPIITTSAGHLPRLARRPAAIARANTRRHDPMRRVGPTCQCASSRLELQSMRTTRAVIIGAGIGGLAAGIRAATSGLRRPNLRALARSSRGRCRNLSVGQRNPCAANPGVRRGPACPPVFPIASTARAHTRVSNRYRFQCPSWSKE